MSLCRRTVENRLPLERVPLACTFGSPLDLHVRQSLSLQGPADLDHHRVEFLVAHQQWLSMIVHNCTVHPGAVWLVQSEPNLRAQAIVVSSALTALNPSFAMASSWLSACTLKRWRWCWGLTFFGAG